jgi:hypothetical protein
MVFQVVSGGHFFEFGEDLLYYFHQKHLSIPYLSSLSLCCSSVSMLTRCYLLENGFADEATGATSSRSSRQQGDKWFYYDSYYMLVLLLW